MSTPATDARDGPCGAQLRCQPGVYCQKWPVQGRTRCRLHGGRSPRGEDSPSFLHGRRSKYRVGRAEFWRAREAVAVARILFDRAIAAGSSGLPEMREVLRCVREYAALTKGNVVPPDLRRDATVHLRRA